MRQNLFILVAFLVITIAFCSNSYAKAGCCSYHGGVCGNSCCDGTPLSALCRDSYTPVCDSTHKYLCHSQYDCLRAGGNWCNNRCQSSACEPICDVNHYNLCNDESSCTLAGGYWCNDQCQSNNDCVSSNSNAEFYHVGEQFTLSLKLTVSAIADLYIAIQFGPNIWFLVKDGNNSQINLSEIPHPYEKNLSLGYQELGIFSFLVPESLIGSFTAYLVLNKAGLALSADNLISPINVRDFSFLGVESELNVKCCRVIDGDTIKVGDNSSLLTIRFYGIDAPEISQPWGVEAKNFLESLIANKVVHIEPITHDRYGRIVGIVSYNGMNVDELLVSNGYAWLYEKYCKRQECSLWSWEEQQARNVHEGLWSDINPIPPWEWRTTH